MSPSLQGGFSITGPPGSVYTTFSLSVSMVIDVYIASMSQFIINSAAMDIGYACIFLNYIYCGFRMPRTGITGSYGSFFKVFKFFLSA